MLKSENNLKSVSNNSWTKLQSKIPIQPITLILKENQVYRQQTIESKGIVIPTHIKLI